LEGRVRLYEIVNRVLESGRALDWVSVYGGIIADVFASGPAEELLELCRRNNHLQQDRNTEEVHRTQIEKVLVTPSDQFNQDNEEFAPWMRRDDYNYYDLDYDDHDDVYRTYEKPHGLR
jgi:radical SAM superfamily enzyme YgiQ (UPF0313 family)